MHTRVLISNRGEIAIRIAKSATALDLESVGVYPAIDALSLHTRCMTESHEIGTAADSVGAYLNAKALVQTAKARGCDCLHPGYGFLSEHAPFAELCAAEGITFIGPPPEALSLFGDKVRARALAESLGIPVVPGSAEPMGSALEAEKLAHDLGYPVMLKAATGGGGRGMRVVEKAEQMAEAFARCSSEARPHSVMEPFFSKGWSRDRDILKSKFWPTHMARWSIFTNGTARCNCDTRRSSRWPPLRVWPPRCERRCSPMRSRL